MGENMSEEYEVDNYYVMYKSLKPGELAVLDISEEIKMVTDVKMVALNSKLVVMLGFTGGVRAGAKLTKEELKSLTNVTALILLVKDRIERDGVVKDF